MYFFSKFSGKQFVKNGLLFVLFSMINNGISFLIVIFMSKLISPIEYGKLNLFMTLTNIGAILISLGTISYPCVDFFKVSKRQTAQNTSVVLSILISIFIILLLLFFVFEQEIVPLLGLGIWLVVAALCVSLVQQIQTVLLNIFRLEEKISAYGILSIGNVFITTVLTLLLMGYYSMGWLGRVYSLLITGIILCFISMILIRKKQYLICNIAFFKKRTYIDALYYGIPLIPHSLSWWLKQGVDRFIINYFHGNAAVGLFSFGFNFANILVIIAEAFNASYSVVIYKELSNQRENTLLNLLKKNYYIIAFYFFISIITIFLTHLVVPIVFPEYIDSLSYTYPLCGSAFFQSVYYVFVNFLFFKKKTKILMFITFGSATLHLCLSLLLTRYNSIFAAYILLFTNVLITSCVIYYVNRLYHLPWKVAFKVIWK